MMRKERIAIIALQETKLTQDEADEIMKANPKIKILANGETTAKAGVAFVINTELIRESQVKMSNCHELTVSLI